MKYADIKRYLKPYSILNSRKTTINHAFASALAPYDRFDPHRIAEALAELGQSDIAILTCVYCDAPAETWDHLVSIVKDSELHGYGHQIGNLVPCCKTCNSKKGSKDWRKFISQTVASIEERSLRETRISTYLSKYAIEVDLTQAKKQEADWQRYLEIRQEMFALMREADEVAGRLRVSLIST